MATGLSAEEARRLTDERVALSRLQTEALTTSTYLGMDLGETHLYEERRMRLREIRTLLGEFETKGK